MFSRILTTRRRAAAEQDYAAEQDSGFMLLEAIVAISVITVVMTALTMLLVTVTHNTSTQRGAQTAAQLTVSALDRANSLGAVDAVRGRDSASVDTQFATPLATSSSVAPWLATMTPATDSAASSGEGADPDKTALPTKAISQTVNGTTFETSYFVGYCWRPATQSGDCVTESDADDAQQAAASSSLIQSTPVEYVRVVTATVWHASACPDSGCTYVSATILNGLNDPVFNFDQSPPAAPVLSPVDNQTSALGDAVKLQLNATGIAPLIFSGSVALGSGSAVALPTDSTCAETDPDPSSSAGSTPSGGAGSAPAGTAGSTPSSTPSVDESAYGFLIDPTCGLITGTPTQAGTYQFTIIVTDAFLNTSTPVTFTWKVSGAGLSFTAPANQTNAIGDKVNLAMSGATGGTAPYTWTASGLPAGLSIDKNTGAISGTITAGSANPTTVTVTMADSAKATPVSQTFTWTVPVSGPSISAPTVPATVVGSTVNSIAASYNCPNTPCTVSVSGAPSGLAFGNASTGSSKSGTVTLSTSYWHRTVTGSAMSYSTTLTITDSKSKTSTASFTWTVSPAAPTIGSLNDQTLTSQGVKVVPSYTCPTTCTFSLTGSKQSGSSVFPSSFSYQQPGGWSDSSVGYILGFDPNSGTFTIGSSAYSYVTSQGSWSYTITITITDTKGRSASSSFKLSWSSTSGGGGGCTYPWWGC